MAKKPNTLLTSKHIEDLRRLRNSVASTREYILKCQKCNLDIEEELAATTEQATIIESLLREFAPDQI